MARIFISIILLFGAAVIGLFYLGPEWRTFQGLRGRLEELTATSIELDALAQNRDELVSQINSLSQRDLARIEKAVPQGTQGAEFLVSLEAFAVQRGLLLKRVDLASLAEAERSGSAQPRPSGLIAVPSAAGGVKELPISLNVQGSYQNLKAFLNDLEMNLRITDVEELSFTAPARPGIFDFSLKLKTYYQ